MLTKEEVDAVHSTIEMELFPCASQERATQIADYVRALLMRELKAQPSKQPTQ